MEALDDEYEPRSIGYWRGEVRELFQGLSGHQMTTGGVEVVSEAVWG